jgi:hypothetical protein
LDKGFVPSFDITAIDIINVGCVIDEVIDVGVLGKDQVLAMD